MTLRIDRFRILTPARFIGRGLVPLLAVLATPVVWAQDGPQVTAAYGSSPGGITVGWQDAAGADYYVVDVRQVRSQQLQRTAGIDALRRDHTVLGLRAGTAYEVRVCADVNRDLSCSHEDAARWVPASTLAAPGPATPVPAPSPAPAPAAPLVTPQLIGLALRDRDNGPVAVSMRITRMGDVPAAQRQRIVGQQLSRDGVVIDQSTAALILDRQPRPASKYIACWQMANPSQTLCSQPLSAGYLGSVTSIKHINLSSWMTHSGFKAWVDMAMTSAEQKHHATFVARPGRDRLAGTISLETTTSPKFFLSNVNGRLVVEAEQNDEAFRRRASFRVIRPAKGWPAGNDWIFNLGSMSQPGASIVSNGTALEVKPIGIGTLAQAGFIQDVVQFPAVPGRLRDDFANTAIKDMPPMPTANLPAPTRKIGKRTSGSPASTTPVDHCVAAKRARERRMPANAIAIHDALCARSRE